MLSALFIYVLVAGFIGVMVNWYKDKHKPQPIEEVIEETPSESEGE